MDITASDRAEWDRHRRRWHDADAITIDSSFGVPRPQDLCAQRERELAQVFIQFLASPDYNLSPALSFKHCPPVKYNPSLSQLRSGELMFHQLNNALAFMRFFDHPNNMSASDIDTAQRIWTTMSRRRDGYVHWEEFLSTLLHLFDSSTDAEVPASSSTKNTSVRRKLAHLQRGHQQCDESAGRRRPTLSPRRRPPAPIMDGGYSDGPTSPSPTRTRRRLHLPAGKAEICRSHTPPVTRGRDGEWADAVQRPATPANGRPNVLYVDKDGPRLAAAAAATKSESSSSSPHSERWERRHRSGASRTPARRATAAGGGPGTARVLYVERDGAMLSSKRADPTAPLGWQMHGPANAPPPEVRERRRPAAVRRQSPESPPTPPPRSRRPHSPHSTHSAEQQQQLQLPEHHLPQQQQLQLPEHHLPQRQQLSEHHLPQQQQLPEHHLPQQQQQLPQQTELLQQQQRSPSSARRRRRSASPHAQGSREQQYVDGSGQQHADGSGLQYLDVTALPVTAPPQPEHWPQSHQERHWQPPRGEQPEADWPHGGGVPPEQSASQPGSCHVSTAACSGPTAAKGPASPPAKALPAAPDAAFRSGQPPASPRVKLSPHKAGRYAGQPYTERPHTEQPHSESAVPSRPPPLSVPAQPSRDPSPPPPPPPQFPPPPSLPATRPPTEPPPTEPPPTEPPPTEPPPAASHIATEPTASAIHSCAAPEWAAAPAPHNGVPGTVPPRLSSAGSRRPSSLAAPPPAPLHWASDGRSASGASASAPRSPNRSAPAARPAAAQREYAPRAGADAAESLPPAESTPFNYPRPAALDPAMSMASPVRPVTLRVKSPLRVVRPANGTVPGSPTTTQHKSPLRVHATPSAREFSDDRSVTASARGGPPAARRPPSLAARREERRSQRDTPDAAALDQKWQSLHTAARELDSRQSPRAGLALQGPTFSEIGERQSAAALMQRQALASSPAARRGRATVSPGRTPAQPQSLVIERAAGERLGMSFEDHTVLSAVRPGLAAARCGAAAFIGRRVSCINNEHVSTLDDVRIACRGHTAITLAFVPLTE
eukprot:TRINITY_DN6595_c0_g1_i2.p1 TRINITY_DN6595_c0_g1~~TRINITY_DN6595_c0_g1_i2.p1  ORF type:complete len:1057 (+),score=176.20 TRINITY_DN6595_c0_g1_i2:129-3299(+)